MAGPNSPEQRSEFPLTISLTIFLVFYTLSITFLTFGFYNCINSSMGAC